MIEVTERDGAVMFMVRLHPRASRDAIEGEHDGALKVRLTAPPVDGRANEALRKVLAEKFRVAISVVQIVAGEKSRTKRVSVAGVSKVQVVAILEAATGGKK